MRTLTVAAAFALLAPGLATQRIASSSIAGEIRTVDGAAAAGIRVSALAVPANSISATGTSVTLSSLAQTDGSGRFRLEDLPPGRYYVTAGLLDFPTYYPGVKTQADARIVTLGAGAAVSGINFALARPAGVRVSGRVNGFPAGTPAGLLRVALVPSTGGAAFDAPVQSDGTFELLKISPGRYAARMTPGVSGVAAVQVQVDDKDIPNIEMAVPAFVLGHVAVDNGSKLPVQMAALAAGVPDPPTLVQLRGTRVDSTAPAAAAQSQLSVANNLTATLAALRVGGTVSTAVRADGYFIFNAPAGDYQLAAIQLPFGYSLKSAALDPAGSRLDVTLTTAPLAGEPTGATISGHVTGLAPAGTATRFVSITVAGAATASPPSTPLQRVGQAPILEDGSFEVLRVPSGPATIQVYSGTTSNLSMRLDVGGDQDMTIEVSVGPRTAPLGWPPSTLPLATPAPPIMITIPGPALPSASRITPAPAPSPDAGIQQNPGVRISGMITGVAPTTGEAFPSRTIALIQGSMQPFQALIFEDNSFEFSHVPPGSYNVRLSLGLTYLLSKPIVVEEKDLTGLEIAVPGR